MSKKTLLIPDEAVFLHGSTLNFELQQEALHYLRQITQQGDFELVLILSDRLGNAARETLRGLLKSESIPIRFGIENNNAALQLEQTIWQLSTEHTPAAREDAEYSIGFNYDSAVDVVCTNWAEVYHVLALPDRVAEVTRTTSETEIKVNINLDGSGQSDISTGIGFFDHMLEQVARHGNIDLVLHCTGDLHIDEHHTIEDVALALGAAFYEALGDKKGLQRYGFILPMDEARADVALDFSGRNWLVWEAEFKREMIGKMPTEMFKHFFKSLTDSAQLTLHIKAEGENEHHKIEAIFKGFGRALRMALQRNLAEGIPSSKGTL